MKDSNAKMYKDSLTIYHLRELWRRKVLALLGKLKQVKEIRET